MEIMDKAEYHKQRKLEFATAAHQLPLSTYSNRTATPVTVEKRGCKQQTIFRTNPDQTFLNWDVAMSSVIKGGANDGDTTVSVTAGYQISNSITVTEGISASTPDAFLSASFSIAYDETWTSSYKAAYSYQVPANKYAAVVSNPAVTRKTGQVDIGCVGTATTGEYTADSYESKAYGGLSWVDGIISLCTGDEYPLKMCVGDGTIS